LGVSDSSSRARAYPVLEDLLANLVTGQLSSLLIDLMTTVSQSRAACVKAGELRRRVRATCEASARLRQKAVGLRRRVRFAIGGGSHNRDIPISEAAIRAQLRRLLEGGILPRWAPTVVAGQSEGRRRCTGCRVHFQRGDVEYAIIVAQTVSLVLHRRCIELWTELVLDRSRPPIQSGQDTAACPGQEVHSACRD
jgi:hypothetical protein